MRAPVAIEVRPRAADLVTFGVVAVFALFVAWHFSAEVVRSSGFSGLFELRGKQMLVTPIMVTVSLVMLWQLVRTRRYRLEADTLFVFAWWSKRPLFALPIQSLTQIDYKRRNTIALLHFSDRRSVQIELGFKNGLDLLVRLSQAVAERS